jgi:hypothetical protein
MFVGEVVQWLVANVRVAFATDKTVPYPLRILFWGTIWTCE